MVALIRPYAQKRSCKVRNDAITLEKRVAITLYYLKDQGSMTMVANTFGVARCTVGQVVFEICGILTKHLRPKLIHLRPKLIHFPTTKTEVEDTSAHFLKKIWLSECDWLYKKKLNLSLQVFIIKFFILRCERRVR